MLIEARPCGTMTEWLAISAREAVEALRTRAVYAIEQPDGTWGEVTAIDDVLEQGLRTPAYRIRFVSGRVRIATGERIFRVERGAGRGNG